MQRTFLLLIVGVTVGATVAYVAGRDAPRMMAGVDAEGAVSPERTPSVPELRAADFLTLATGVLDMAERAAAYRFVAQADAALLASLARQVVLLPAARSRAFALETLFARYAELDARAALALAHELELEKQVEAAIYARWVHGDSAAALEALAALDAETATSLGVALLEVFGNDERGIAQVLARAPQVDAPTFRARAAIARAAVDPASAAEDALRLPAAVQGSALMRIAVLWAARDAPAALARFSRLDEPLLREFLEAAIIREWASRDPEATLAYLVRIGPEDQRQALLLGALQAFIEIEPARALAAAERLSGRAAVQLRQLALASLARTAPLEALRQVETMPPGAQREQMLGLVATAYGRLDPDAALSWVQSLSPASTTLVASVLEGLARVDAERAIDLLFTMTPPNEQQRVLTVLVASGTLSADHTAAAAERLLGTVGRGSQLNALTTVWAQRDPAAAIPWLIAQRERVPAGALARAATALAQSDPVVAADYLARIPNDLRATWLAAVARGYAQNDPRAAVDWVAQYRGQAGYDAAVAAVAQRTANEDARVAARLLDSLDWTAVPNASVATAAVASSWARQEPFAAANWAANLADEDARLTAVSRAAEVWVSRDVGASRAWVMSLAPGATRDAALVPFLTVAAASGALDHALLDAFSSQAAAQLAVSQFVGVVAARDPAAARRLIDEHLWDPALRAAAERLIAQSSSAGTPQAGRGR